VKLQFAQLKVLSSNYIPFVVPPLFPNRVGVEWYSAFPRDSIEPEPSPTSAPQWKNMMQKSKRHLCKVCITSARPHRDSRTLAGLFTTLGVQNGPFEAPAPGWSRLSQRSHGSRPRRTRWEFVWWRSLCYQHHPRRLARFLSGSSLSSG
jgi:hypothetical protein